MNIAIIGYGKMGKLIAQIAERRGHQIGLKISSNNLNELNEKNLKGIDVAIEFSVPDSGYQNVKKCLKAGINTISGTTGWTEHLPEMQDLAQKNNCGFIYASNFSLGVNLFFALNQHLAKLLVQYPEYKASIEEIHHTSKKDSPSGTAITLANDIISETHYKSWINAESEQADQLSIISKRIDPAPGTHVINYESEIDSISINHTAHSREGFALGAVIASEWVNGKKGNFTMKDVLNLKG